jgi:hypothetical protein
MGDTNDFFTNWLPEKLKNNPDLVKSINAVYVFDLDGDQWTVDLTGAGEITHAGHPNAGCTVTVGKADFENMLDNPSSAMMMFMSGKLKVTNVGLGINLQKLLS